MYSFVVARNISILKQILKKEKKNLKLNNEDKCIFICKDYFQYITAQIYYIVLVWFLASWVDAVAVTFDLTLVLQVKGAVQPRVDKRLAGSLTGSLKDNTKQWREQGRYFMHTWVHMLLFIHLLM